MNLLDRLKSATAEALHRSGTLAIARGRVKPGGIVLTYHRVGDDPDPFVGALPTVVFRQQMELLRRDHQVVPLEELMAWLKSGAGGKPRVAITIDDGHRDTYETIYPILRRLDLPATLFLTTGPPETGVPLWFDRMRSLLKLTRSPQLSLPARELGPWPLGSVAERLAAARHLSAWLKSVPAPVLDEVVAELERTLDVPAAAAAADILGWPEIKELAAGGIAIGGHTHRHYVMSRLAPAQLAAELEISLGLLHTRLGLSVRTFAYPNGRREDFSSESRAALAAAGIRFAFSTRPGFVQRSDDPFDLPRVYTSIPSLARFACRLAGIGAWEEAESKAG